MFMFLLTLTHEQKAQSLAISDRLRAAQAKATTPEQKAANFKAYLKEMDEFEKSLVPKTN